MHRRVYTIVPATLVDATASIVASGDLAADQTLTLDLKWDGGGTVNGVILNAAGNQITNGYVSVEAYGASGPAGNFNWTASITNGAFTVSGVPAGRASSDSTSSGCSPILKAAGRSGQRLSTSRKPPHRV